MRIACAFERLNAGVKWRAVPSSRIPAISTMHPTLVREPFHRDGWTSEEKYDGWPPETLEALYGDSICADCTKSKAKTLTR